MQLFNILHNEINKPFSSYLNDFTDNKIIWKIVYTMADAPIFLVPLFLVWFWFYFSYKKDAIWKNKLLFIFYSTIVAVLISISIQQFVQIDRPEESLKAAWKMILEHIPDASFPSDHASVSISFLASLFLFWFSRYWFFFFPFFIIMLLSRIAWGLHWAFDILVWSIVWIVSSFIIYKSQNLNIFKKINNCILKITSYFKL